MHPLQVTLNSMSQPLICMITTVLSQRCRCDQICIKNNVSGIQTGHNKYSHHWLFNAERGRQCDTEKSVMVTWQKGGESLSVLFLLCLKIWHMHSQQQQWCNLVTRLWHLYSRPKPGSYLPYQRLYIQRERNPCFPSDCKRDKQGGMRTLFTCPSVKRRLLTFSSPPGKRLTELFLSSLKLK